MSKTFTELGALTGLAGVDVFAVVDMTDATTKKITATNIAAFLADLEQTLANKTLTSPVLNGTLSGTAFLDEDDMASDSAVAAASQQSIKAHVASGSVTFSNKNFSQNGGMTITDTGTTGDEYPLDIFAPNMTNGYEHIRFGKNASVYNYAKMRFYYVSDGNQSNGFMLGVNLADAIWVNGYNNTGLGTIPAGSDGARLTVYGTSEITDTLTLSKASGTGLSVTSDIDFNAIASGATKAEINTTCDGNTATAAEITARCDGVPNYSTDDNSGIVTVTSEGVQVATLDLGTVTSGDVFYIEAQLFYTKGGTGGTGNYYINQASGTATIAFPTAAIASGHNDTASAAYNRHLGGMCFVTGSGTLVMQVVGTSGGSDSTIASGAGDLAATFIKKQ
jgi:hypothetical protein